MKEEKKKSRLSKLWLPFVVIVGATIGFLSNLSTSEAPHFDRFTPFDVRFQFEIFREFHNILSTIGIALLVALLVVYARTYRETKANFILGLLVVLFALLLQSILTYPILLNFIEPTPYPNNFPYPFPPNFYSPIADALTIIAYAVFLYLSLE